MTSSAKPLEGRSIVLTRAAQQASELAERLEALGARVLLLPAVSFSEPADTAQLDRAIASLAEFDWMLFTSANAVRFFAERCRKAGCDPRMSATPRCAAVGPVTASAAAAEGYTIDYTAQEFLGLALARELGPALAGKRVLLPRSSRASRDLPEALAKAGALVTEAIAYDTGGMGPVGPGVLDAVREARFDAISFFSASAVENLKREIGAEAFARLGTRVVAAVGPVTAVALRKMGLRVTIEGAESTAESMAMALADYFSSNHTLQARSS